MLLVREFEMDCHLQPIVGCFSPVNLGRLSFPNFQDSKLVSCRHHQIPQLHLDLPSSNMTVPAIFSTDPTVQEVCTLNEKSGLYKLRLVLLDDANMDDLPSSKKLFFILHTYDIYKHIFRNEATFDIVLPTKSEESVASSSQSPIDYEPFIKLPAIEPPKGQIEKRAVWESKNFFIRGVSLSTVVVAVMSPDLVPLVKPPVTTNPNPPKAIFDIECWESNIACLEAPDVDAELLERTIVSKILSGRNLYRKPKWTLLKRIVRREE